MAGFDRNGLELSDQINGTLSSYKYVAYNLTSKRYIAICNRATGFKMTPIGHFKDVREAAFIAQAFNAKYDTSSVEDFVRAGNFEEFCDNFVGELDVPDFKFPAEGYSIEDYLNDHTLVEEKQNRCDTPRDALVMVIKKNGLPTPSLKEVSVLISQVEEDHANTNNWIKSAERVMCVA